jgi:hypothetical protein
MSKPDDKCKTPAARQANALRGSWRRTPSPPLMLEAGSTEDIVSPERYHSRPLQPHSMIALSKSRAPSRHLLAVGHCYRCAGSAAILTVPCGARNLLGTIVINCRPEASRVHRVKICGRLACRRRLALKVRGLSAPRVKRGALLDYRNRASMTLPITHKLDPRWGNSRSDDWDPQWVRFAKMRKARKGKTNPYILAVAHVTII